MVLLIPNPFRHRSDGLYGERQEAAIEFVGGVAGVVAKAVPIPWVKLVAGGLTLSCEAALYLDAREEAKYKAKNLHTTVYETNPTGVVYYF